MGAAAPVVGGKNKNIVKQTKAFNARLAYHDTNLKNRNVKQTEMIKELEQYSYRSAGREPQEMMDL